MAYGRKKTYKRRTYRRGRGGSLLSRFSRMRVGTVASRALAGVRYLKGLVNSEKYHKDNAIAGNIDGNNPTIQHLNNIAQGDGDGNRSGNSILMKKITYNYSFDGAANLNSAVRVVVLIDSQQIGDTTPGWLDVFESVSVNTLMAKATLGRFTIVYDKIHNFNIAGVMQITRRGIIYIPRHARYNGANTNDIQKNGVYFMCCSDQGTVFPIINSNYRLYYHDN